MALATSGHSDHPREYGENATDYIVHVAHCGSSPRIRGEYLIDDLEENPQGIIPANTGRIVRFTKLSTMSWDHPREYGENAPSHSKPCTRTGSSPRIRGEYRECQTCRSTVGIIPANTGRISSRKSARRSSPDHPREYGENYPQGSGRVQVPGSSPRIRGECGRPTREKRDPRIIPANTGRIFWVLATS